MRVNELMHGDWVFFPIQNNEPAQVCGKILSYEKELGNAEVDISPIPLTPEILEKNGFENKADYEWSTQVKNYYAIYNRNYMPTLSIGKIDNMGMEDEEVNYESTIYFEKTPYVHELQHALRLCGLNELADNFKI